MAIVSPERSYTSPLAFELTLITETFYYDVAPQLRRLDEEILAPIRRVQASGAKEIPPEERERLIQTSREILQAISDAYTAWYARLRPAWRARTAAELPSYFCPLAIAIQHNINHPVQLTKPRDMAFSDHWECPECSALTKKCYETGTAKDPARVPFVGHLKATVRNEVVKHACAGCLKVFDDWKGLDSHVFMVDWEGWVCGPPPAVLRRYLIGTLAID